QQRAPAARHATRPGPGRRSRGGGAWVWEAGGVLDAGPFRSVGLSEFEYGVGTYRTGRGTEEENMAASQPSGRRRAPWSQARPTKTAVFWWCVLSIVATMIVGFTWGGWVTGGTARRMAEARGEDAVIKRLAPMCVVRFNQDPLKAQKLKDLRATSSWDQIEYVQKQGWA